MSEEAFERYLRGNLSREDRKELDRRLAEDAEFAEKFEEEKLVWQTREVLLGDQLRKDLTELNSLPAPKNRLKMVMGLISLAVVVVLLFLYYRHQSSGIEQHKNRNPVIESEQEPTSEKMEQKTLPEQEEKKEVPQGSEKSGQRKTNTQFAMELYGNGPNWSQMRGSDDVQDSAQLAVAAYLSGNYAECLALLGGKNQRAIALLELQAHTLLHPNRYDEASKILKEIADSKQIPYYERSQWYYILSEIAAGRWATEETGNMVKEILSDQEHEYFEKLRQLQNDRFLK